VKESGILKEVFERTYYVKPSIVKRQKRLFGKYRQKKRDEENN
jgi:ribosomal protein S21